jgi:hypothetical protein
MLKIPLVLSRFVARVLCPHPSAHSCPQSFILSFRPVVSSRLAVPLALMLWLSLQQSRPVPRLAFRCLQSVARVASVSQVRRLHSLASSQLRQLVPACHGGLAVARRCRSAGASYHARWPVSGQRVRWWLSSLVRRRVPGPVRVCGSLVARALGRLSPRQQVAAIELLCSLLVPRSCKTLGL